ncbi:MAG: trypsin-like peptidase domain-containing protein [Chloroflexi bacterium]|nr:trypsin-like peptidase domain-containing protein [Chloroflexota bacterium]MCI0867406.1 trypsin-like peptidase domain-containing protein [Chloroflexota bacterium]MCI0893418.1 trypsin-like peptidase domain-containing protein [Chloroflexota bacterium]
MSEILQNLSNDLAETVTTAGPAVVRVEARDRLPASGIAWSADGVVVTAHHVVERDDNINIGLADGRTIPAALVGRDPTTDLAVLRAETSGLSAPAWDGGDDLRVGHLVLALGRPGNNVRATMGIVGALGKSWRTPSGGTLDRYLQTDLVMYPGFSGGPLVGADGRVLGLNTSALLRGVSLTVPFGTLRRVVEALLAHGRISRSYLGVGSQPTRLPEGLVEQLGQETGLLLVSVEPGSPAEEGKLYLGDTIVALDGQPVRHLDDLLSNLGSDRIGNTVPVRIVRGGQVQEVDVTLREHP